MPESAFPQMLSFGIHDEHKYYKEEVWSLIFRRKPGENIALKPLENAKFAPKYGQFAIKSAGAAYFIKYDCKN